MHTGLLPRRFLTLSSLGLLLLFGMLSASLHAQTRVWDGGGADNSWGTADNWDVLPVNGNSLAFDGSTRTSNTNDSLTSIGALTFNSTASAFTLSGNDLTVGAITSSNNDAVNTINNNLNRTSSTILIQGTSTLALAGVISGANGIIRNSFGLGTLRLLNDNNSFTGPITLSVAGVTEFTSVANAGSNSALGAATGADSTIQIGGTTNANPTLRYIGSSDSSTNRTIHLGGTTGSRTIDASGEGSVKYLGGVTSSGSGSKTVVLTGSSTATNEITTIPDDSVSTVISLSKTGAGSWTLSGNNTFTGNTTLGSGLLRLDYSTNGGSKLSDTGVLALNGGTVELSGGNHTEAVASTTLTTGGTFIKRTSGTSSLAMGAITFTSGAIDFGAANIATTTTNNTNGILNQRATVAGADFASNDGSNNIVAYAGYTPFAGSMAADTNYSLTGNATLAGATGATSNTLKIAPAAPGQSLTVGTNILTVGSLLFTGSEDFTISTSSATRLAVNTLLNYGSGDLYYGSIGSTGLTQFGTGRTILTQASSSTAAPAITINGGIVQFSDNAQIGRTLSNLTVALNTGTLVADTTGGAIALNNGGPNSRSIRLDAGGGTIDVIGGNSVTISGVISGTVGGPLTLGSGSTNGTIILSGANSHTGTTTIGGGVVQLGDGGTTGSLAAAGVIINNATLRFNRSNTMTQGTDFSTTGISGNGSLQQNGTGTVILNAANGYTGATTVNGGTLLISGSGSINSTSGITVNNSGSRFSYTSWTGLTRNVTLNSGGEFSHSGDTNYSGTLTWTNGVLGGTNWNGTSLDNRVVDADRTISPGNSPGTASTGNQTWGTDGGYIWELNNATGTMGDDPGWDLLTGTGTLTISATLANPFTISITSLTLGNEPGAATNFDADTNYQWRIADFANPVTGFSSNAFDINDAGFINSTTPGSYFSVVLGNDPSVTGGDNSQIYLTYTIPEPTSALLVGFGLASLLLRRRTRRSK